MAENDKPRILQPSTRWTHFRAVPFKHIWVLLAAVFFLFSVIGPYVDLNLTNGVLPYAVMAAIAILLVVATDRILEVSNKNGSEYGAEQLMEVIGGNAKDPLPELAQQILKSARTFGSQFHHQTILLVGCL
jgi:hypothetical protein